MEAITNIPQLGLIWQPMISPQRIVGMMAVMAALAIVVYARSMRHTPWISTGLLAMRLAVLAALATLLMGPSAAPPPRPKTLRPYLHVLVDTSQSMLTQDMGRRSRLAAVQQTWLSPERIDALGQVCRPSFYGFDLALRPMSLELLRGSEDEVATGTATHLAQSVRRCIEQAQTDPAGVAVLVVSDGRDSNDASMQPIALLARVRGIAIHTVCVGGPTRQKDIVVSASPAQRYLLAGTQGYIRVRAHQEGLDAVIEAAQKQDRPLQVNVACDGKTESVPLRFDGQGRAAVDLPIRQDAAGEYSYRIWVEPLDEEFEPANNVQHAFVEVVDQRIRALLLEGEPYWETRFAARALRKDPRIELTYISEIAADKQVVIVNRSGAATPKAPTTLEELRDYDVVILGRGLERILSADVRRLLVEYVGDHGGNLIFARGRAYDPATSSGRQAGRDIAVLEPVVWGRGPLHNLAMAPTPAGRRGIFYGAWDEQVEADQAPSFTIMPAVDRVKTGAAVLARAVEAGRATLDPDSSDPPALVRMDYGSGRVLAVLGEGLWRWGLASASDSQDVTRPYERFWSSMVGWLVMGSDFKPGQDTALLLGALGTRLGEPLLIEAACKTARAEGFDPAVRVTAPDGTVTAVALRPSPGSRTRLQGAVVPEQAGVYVVHMTSENGTPPKLEKRFNVTDASLERLKASADPGALARLTEETGGMVFRSDQAGRFPLELAGRFTSGSDAAGPRHVWDTWPVLVVLLVWAGCEWIFRKRAGLL